MMTSHEAVCDWCGTSTPTRELRVPRDWIGSAVVVESGMWFSQMLVVEFCSEQCRLHFDGGLRTEPAGDHALVAR